ncbi:MAG: hypothetical protein Q4E33_03080 [Erysipelotrichaceae bacterium]|nr:hypothetical protein [Erysipelotrichaceae bacterium]
MNYLNRKFNDCIFSLVNGMDIIINILDLRLRGLRSIIIVGC